MITPAQQHWQNVMAQRAGRANEGVDYAARTAHEEVLYRLRLAQARLKGVQARSAKAAIKKSCCRIFPAGLRERWRLTAGSRMK